MRLFVAAELPVGMRDALSETSALLRGSVRGRYVAPDSFHVTLAFLGEVAGHRVDAVVAAVDRGCSGFGRIPVSFGDFGTFGRRASATLWQGFREAGDLPALADAVRVELREAGFSFDAKAFLPHVTLMRAADVRGGVLPMPASAAGEIASVTVFRSDLSGQRPVYDPLHTVHLLDR